MTDDLICKHGFYTDVCAKCNMPEIEANWLLPKVSWLLKATVDPDLEEAVTAFIQEFPKNEAEVLRTIHEDGCDFIVDIGTNRYRLTYKRDRRTDAWDPLITQESQVLKVWKSTFNYMGTDLSDYYVVLSQSEDETLSKSNFDVALARLGGKHEPEVIVASFGGWAGSFEQLMVLKTATDKVKIAEDIVREIDHYPVLDDDDYQQKEEAEYQKNWINFGKEDTIRELELVEEDMTEADLNKLRWIWRGSQEGSADDPSTNINQVKQDWQHYKVTPGPEQGKLPFKETE